MRYFDRLLPSPVYTTKLMPLKMQRSAQGFTLLELLVVLVIIGILFSFAVLSLNTRPNPVKQAAYQIQQLLNLAVEDSILRGQILGWTLTTTQQIFSRYQNQQWQILTQDPLLGTRPLDPMLHYHLQIEGLDITPSTKNLPQIILLPDGTLSHFILLIQDTNTELTYKIYTHQNTIKLILLNQA